MGILLFVYSRPFSVDRIGDELRVPSTGSSFITGTITKFSYEEISLSPSYSSTEKLVLDGLSVGGSSTFDLIGRDATTATGRFNLDQFVSLPNSENWEIEGSDERDVIGLSR